MTLTYKNSALFGLYDLCAQPVHRAYDKYCTDTRDVKVNGSGLVTDLGVVPSCQKLSAHRAIPINLIPAVNTGE
jgi:hypothetical protein